MRYPANWYEQYEPSIQRLPEVVFDTANGTDLHLEVIRPINISKPLPAVLWIHGGGWGWRGNKGSYRELMQLPFAAAGFCAIGVEYRLSAFEKYPAQIVDVKRALVYIRDHADELGVDPDRIGIWGRSAGGHLASLCGVSAGAEDFGVDDEPVQAVVSCFGPSDLSVILEGLVPEREAHIRMVTSTFLDGQVEDKQELVSLANPLRYLAAIGGTADLKHLPKFLFVHGVEDRSVPFSQSKILHDRLRQLGVVSTLLGVEHANHGLLSYPEDASIEPPLDKVHGAIMTFFRTVLLEA